MRRKSSNLCQEVVLFAGVVKILARTAQNPSTIITRTLIMNEYSYFTYLIPQSPSFSLLNYECQFQIHPTSTAKCYLRKNDPHFLGVLQAIVSQIQPKQLLDSTMGCVTILNNQQMNLLLFQEEQLAMRFSTAYCTAIITQYYVKYNNDFNLALYNRLVDALTDSLIIDANQIQEQDIDFIIKASKLLPSISLQLRFKIIDKQSIVYAERLLLTKPTKLILAHCPLLSLFNLSFGAVPLLSLTLSHNALPDACLYCLRTLTQLCNIDLSHNCIRFMDQKCCIEFLENRSGAVELDVSHNQIANYRFLMKYIINAEGSIVSYINLTNNPLKQDQIIQLTQGQQGVKVVIQSISLREEGALETLKQSHKYHSLCTDNVSSRVNPKTIPLVLSKVPVKINQQETTSRQDVISEYNQAIISDNYLMRRQSKEKQTQLIPIQTKNDQIIIRTFNDVMNLREINQIDLLSVMIRRYGLQGSGVDCAMYLKYKRDQIILNNIHQSGKIYESYIQCILQKISDVYSIKRINSNSSSSFSVSQYLSSTNYQYLLSLSLDQIATKTNTTNDLQQYQVCQYISTIQPSNYIPPLLNPKLLSYRVLSQPLFVIGSDYPPVRAFSFDIPDKSKFLSLYSLQNYKFSTQFIHSGLHANQFTSMLSSTAFQIPIPFIQVIRNLITYLYYTPQKLSQETVTYLTYVIEYIHQSSNESPLIQELTIRLLCSPQQHKLTPTIWTALWQFLTLHLHLQQSLLKFVAAFLLRSNSQVRLYQNQVHFFKNELPIIASCGKYTIQIVDGIRDKVYSCTVHMLDTVQEVYMSLIQTSQFISCMGINKQNLLHCWLCRDAFGTPLKSYQQVGALGPCLYLVRYVYPLHFRHKQYVQRLQIQQLLTLYAYSKRILLQTKDPPTTPVVCFLAAQYIQSETTVLTSQPPRLQQVDDAYEKVLSMVDWQSVLESAKVMYRAQKGELGQRLRQGLAKCIACIHTHIEGSTPIRDKDNVFVCSMTQVRYEREQRRNCLEWGRIVDIRFKEGVQFTHVGIRPLLQYKSTMSGDEEFLIMCHAMMRHVMRVRVDTNEALLIDNQYKESGQNKYRNRGIFWDLEQYYKLDKKRSFVGKHDGKNKLEKSKQEEGKQKNIRGSEKQEIKREKQEMKIEKQEIKINQQKQLKVKEQQIEEKRVLIREEPKQLEIEQIIIGRDANNGRSSRTSKRRSKNK